MYVPLWCKSNFSFLEGASHPEELVEACARLGIETLALTDRDGVYGVVEAHVKAREQGIRLILGSEVSLDDGSTIVLLATSREGYANICRLVTAGRRRSEKGRSRVDWHEVCAHAGDVIALWGGERGLLGGEADPFFVAHALREHRYLNATFTNDAIRLNPDINVSLAVAIDQGLMIPVIRNTDQLTLAEIAAKRKQLVAEAVSEAPEAPQAPEAPEAGDAVAEADTTGEDK